MNDNEVFDFGVRLRALREQRKLTQKDAAEILGKSKGTISGYENNTVTPSYAMLIRLAQLYNASIDYMIGFTDRNSIYIDDLSPTQQRAIIEMLENFRKANQLSAHDK